MHEFHYEDGRLRLVRDAHTRETVTFDAEGAETSREPFTAEENAALDARIAAADTARAEAESRAEAQSALLTATIELSEQAHSDGNPWAQPTGAHDAYAKGATVTHGGKTWTSTTPFNVWEPGVSGWREEGSGEGPAAWVQPTGAHDAYDKGDVVTHNGQTWVSDVDDNVWEPGVYGWGTVSP